MASAAKLGSFLICNVSNDWEYVSRSMTSQLAHACQRGAHVCKIPENKKEKEGYK